MNILIACEMSGRVRDAFLHRGHFAVSCDLLPTIAPDPDEMHWQGDVLQLIREPWLMLPGGERDCGAWDMLVAFPPCTHLASSGARWLTDHWVISKAHPDGRYWHDGARKRAAQQEALAFVRALWECGIPRVCIENPIGALSTKWRKPSQIIQPWQYWHGPEGAGEVKSTCLWLKGLPPLVPTTPNEHGRHQACWLMPPSPERAMLRSLTYPGIAAAMAEAWSLEANLPSCVTL